ncbi:LD-carboxypeptidase [Candidatus Gottesmanbacteria bacterium]|nr:LD-carboxypeptidase [Candidatus Gottesmanbacteria bacterium]
MDKKATKWLKVIQKTIRRPKILKKGCTIAAVAFSDRVTRADMRDIRKSIALLEDWGLKVVVAKHITDQVENRASSSPETVISEMVLLAQNGIDGFYSVKGGFDANRLFHYHNFDRLLKLIAKKRISMIGFSDATTLEVPLIYYKLASFYAPNLTFLHKRTAETKESIYKAIFSAKPFSKIETLQIIQKSKEKKMQGVLVAGNLMTMHDCFASDYNLLTKLGDVILAVEETEESDENVRRFLSTMTSYSSVKAAIVNFKHLGGRDFSKSDIRKMLSRISADDIPVLWYANFGHLDSRKFFRTMGTGWPVELKLHKKAATLNFLSLN